MSRFQGSAFRCDKVVANSITLLEANESIPDKDYNYFFGNDKFSSLYKRLLHEQKRMSGYLERRIYERPLKSEPNFIENQSEHISKLSLHIQSLVKRKFTHCDF